MIVRDEKREVCFATNFHEPTRTKERENTEVKFPIVQNDNTLHDCTRGNLNRSLVTKQLPFVMRRFFAFILKLTVFNNYNENCEMVMPQSKIL